MASTAYFNANTNLKENGTHGEFHQYDESFPPLGGGANATSAGPVGSMSVVKPSPVGTPSRLPPRVGPVKTQGHVTNKTGKGPSGSSATLLISPEERRFQQVNLSQE